jgi:hypothetical protein
MVEKTFYYPLEKCRDVTLKSETPREKFVVSSGRWDIREETTPP